MSEKPFIIRRKATRDFTILINDIFRDSRLSLSEFGLLVDLLHYPPDFLLNLTFLVKTRRSGKFALRSALKGLQKLGYVTIVRERDADGRFLRVVWNVTDLPAAGPKAGFRTVDYPPSENPQSGNPPLLSTNRNKELKRQRTTTTAVSQSPLVVVGSDFENLQIPEVLLGHRKKSTLDALARCPAALRQDVLDEVAGMVARGTHVRSAIGLFECLVAKAKADDGSFVPIAAVEYREKQRQVAAEDARLLDERTRIRTLGPTPAGLEALQSVNRILRNRMKPQDPMKRT